MEIENTNIIAILNERFSETLREFAKNTLLNISKTTLQTTLQVEMTSSNYKEELIAQKKFLKELYIKQYTKEIENFSNIILNNMENVEKDLEEESSYQTKEDLVSIYKEFILLLFVKELEIDFHKNPFILPEKANKSYFYTLRLSDIIGLKYSSNSFLYPIIINYKRILEKLMIESRLNSISDNVLKPEDIKKIITFLEELSIINFFEEDIYQIF